MTGFFFTAFMDLISLLFIDHAFGAKLIPLEGFVASLDITSIFSFDTEQIKASFSNPTYLWLGLFLATYFSEDGALVAGSLLVANASADAALVASALISGILSGDFGLYLLGYGARQSRHIRRYLPAQKIIKFRRWISPRGATKKREKIKQKQHILLFFSRFMPGTRMPLYLTYGFLKLSPLAFLVTLALAGSVWVFTMLYFLNQIQSLFSGLPSYASLVAVIGFMIGVIYMSKKLSKKYFHPPQ